MTGRSNRIIQDVVALMRSAGVRPELIHAYQQTGFLLDEAGYNRLSKADKMEYDAAVDDYFIKHGDK
jgi:hypothetical protein